MVVQREQLVTTLECVSADQEVGEDAAWPASLFAPPGRVSLKGASGRAPDVFVQGPINTNAGGPENESRNPSVRPGAAMSSANTGAQMTRLPRAKAVSRADCAPVLIAGSRSQSATITLVSTAVVTGRGSF